MDDLLRTGDVATLAGVGPTAVKRWADAALLTVVRTAGGHRRYRRSEVEQFLRTRGARVSDGEPWADLLVRPGEPRWLEGRLLSERARCGSWWRVADSLGEALVELGRRWAEGGLAVADEHMASERLARALAHLAEALPLDPAAPCALLACAEGEEHTLGLSLAEVVLRENGWPTRFIGRSTPRGDLVRLTGVDGAGLLGVSASAASNDPAALAATASALGEACDRNGLLLALGGAGAWPEQPSYGSRFHSMEAFHLFTRAAREKAAPR